MAPLLLDGKGILKALHPLFQVLDLALLLGQEEVFDPVQPGGKPALHRLHILFAGRALKPLIDHPR